jgi:hypothetical protein
LGGFPVSPLSGEKECLVVTPSHRWQEDETRFDPAVLLAVVLGIATAVYLATSF